MHTSCFTFYKTCYGLFAVALCWAAVTLGAEQRAREDPPKVLVSPNR